MTKAEQLTGKMLTDVVIETAELLGWRAIHWRPARTKHGWTTAMQGAWAKGFPDIFLCRERLVFAEIKGRGDTVKPEQQAWIDALIDAGVEAYIWRSADWPDQIAGILRRHGPRPQIAAAS